MPGLPMNDVVVVVPGIMGSALQRGDELVWGASIGALGRGLFSRLRTVRDLALPDGVGDEAPDDGVEAVALLRGVHVPIGLWTFDVGYGHLVDRLRARFELHDGTFGPANLVEFPYDWRLSNRHNGARLQVVAERALAEWRDQGGDCADAQLVFVCHSMGGLVARWYVDRLGGHEVTRKVITLGTPHRGALNALDQLVNGVRKGVGPLKADLTDLGRSLPALHQLLPEYACIEAPDGLRKVGEVGLPGLSTAMVGDAVRFHAELAEGRASSAGAYHLHPVLGFRQPTLATARLDRDRAVAMATIDGQDERGDATVPRFAAGPADLPSDHPSLHFVAERHGALPGNGAVLDHIEGILTASPITYRGITVDVSVDIAEVLDPGEPLVVGAWTEGPSGVPLQVVVTELGAGPVEPPIRVPSSGEIAVTLPGPGGYVVEVRGSGPRRPLVGSVTSVVTVWPADLPG